MQLIAHFFAGAFLCNCLPHLLAGLQGQPFPSPFARPRGIGPSSPLVNFLWGSFNLAAGVALLIAWPFGIAFGAPLLVFSVGFLALGVFAARHFGKVMQQWRARDAGSV